MELAVAPVLGKGCMDLMMTLKKILTLHEVQHASEVRRNLISGSFLVRLGFRIVLESNKIVITQGDIFVGKGYVSEDLFKSNVVSPAISSSSSIALNVESCDTWHGRLDHINLDTIRRMMNLNLIPNPRLITNSNVKFVFKPNKPINLSK